MGLGENVNVTSRGRTGDDERTTARLQTPPGRPQRRQKSHTCLKARLLVAKRKKNIRREEISYVVLVVHHSCR